jgi:hypothetical protein
MTEEYIEKMGWDVEPYTEAELIELYKQVSEAADGDPGEGNE